MIQRHDSLVVQQVARLLVPPIQLFAYYVLMHGHYSPGGGFQAGVLIGGSLILQLLVATDRQLRRFSPTREFQGAAGGLAIYFLTGGLALFFGGEFLNYGSLAFFPGSEVHRRYYGILTAEIGVTIVVAMTLLLIFQILAFLPDEK
ncbi:MAG: hypothetical protein A2Z83_00770 [Omnitrophica bacterium GWA2_52_8]|nr:MAG: hypothetical protein A2Z83_00770 [Omnitrophica bacterium GWA2_52_8]